MNFRSRSDKTVGLTDGFSDDHIERIMRDADPPRYGTVSTSRYVPRTTAHSVRPAELVTLRQSRAAGSTGKAETRMHADKKGLHADGVLARPPGWTWANVGAASICVNRFLSACICVSTSCCVIKAETDGASLS
jgi:hypothetical protein